MSAAKHQPATPLPHSGPFAVIFDEGEAFADIPVFSNSDAAIACAERCREETAGNVSARVVQVPLMVKRDLAYPKLVEALRKIVEGWNAIDPDTQVPDAINDGRIEAAETLLRELGEAS